MAQYTPSFIRDTLSGYDTFVRTALEDGDMERVGRKEEEIVSSNLIQIHIISLFFFFNLYRKPFIKFASA